MGIRETSRIVKGKEVKEKLLKGSIDTADAVSTTFGPYGTNVAITKIYNPPHITKDGVTVAEAINLRDPIEDVAAQTIKGAAEETAKIAGDGTTGTSVLSAALIKLASEYLEEHPEKTSEYRRQLEAASKVAVTAVRSLATPTTDKDIYNVALVACNGDSEMAGLVQEAFSIIGKEGIVTVTDSKSYITSLDATKGVKLDRSHIIPSLANGKTLVRHKECRILVTDLDVTTQEDALAVIHLQKELGSPILVICNDLTGVAATIIQHNKTNFDLPIEFIRAPFIADARKEAVEDLAIVTGAKAITSKVGWTSLKSITASHLGSSEMVEISTKETNIIGRKGEEDVVHARIQYYQDKIDQDKEGLAGNYKKRLAMLSAGAAVIYVGGSNEIEVKEKKDRLDDTIRAVRSALEEGVVPGGTMTYVEVACQLHDLSSANSDIPMLHLSIALKSLTEALLSNGNIPFNGENLATLEEQVKRDSILDPALVLTSTLQNAVGAAGVIFTTNCVIIKDDE